jgi:hypothetical protein
MEEEGRVEKAFNVIRSMSLTNVLIMLLMVLIAIPAYFAYRFMTDVAFRREFMSSAIILDMHAPCIVLEGHRYGAQARHSVFIVYGLDGRNEKLLGLRAPGEVSGPELTGLCSRVTELAEQIKEFRRKEELAAPPEKDK